MDFEYGQTFGEVNAARTTRIEPITLANNLLVGSLLGNSEEGVASVVQDHVNAAEVLKRGIDRVANGWGIPTDEVTKGSLASRPSIEICTLARREVRSSLRAIPWPLPLSYLLTINPILVRIIYAVDNLLL